MNRVIDLTFGDMEYEYGWTKRQKLPFWGNDNELKIKVKAHKGERITQEQRDSYNQFIENIGTVSARSLELVEEYVEKYYIKNVYSSVKELVTPRSIVFNQNGSYFILCDFAYDEEHGLGICLSPIEEVGSQDIFL